MNTLYVPNERGWHELGYRFEDIDLGKDYVYVYLEDKKDPCMCIHFRAKWNLDTFEFQVKKIYAHPDGTERKLELLNEEVKLLKEEVANAFLYVEDNRCKINMNLD